LVDIILQCESGGRDANGFPFIKMTYNFDPDRWYDDERGILEARFKAGEMDPQEYEDALCELDRRYDEMLKRLDGTYQIPK
jgi:hypothetical protein